MIAGEAGRQSWEEEEEREIVVVWEVQKREEEEKKEEEEREAVPYLPYPYRTTAPIFLFWYCWYSVGNTKGLGNILLPASYQRMSWCGVGLATARSCSRSVAGLKKGILLVGRRYEDPSKVRSERSLCFLSSLPFSF